MKKVIVALFLLSGTIAITGEARAQVNVNINIGSQPTWGPTGYDHVDFYYLPDINCYYDIARAQFIYLSNNRWIYGKNLPSRYRNVNLYNTYKVVVNQPNPYRNNKVHVKEYARYKGNRSQPVIRDSHDSRYTQSRQPVQNNHSNRNDNRKDNNSHRSNNATEHGTRDNRGGR